MKLDKSTFEELRALQREAAAARDREFEFRFLGESMVEASMQASKHSMDRTSFTALLKYMRSTPQRYAEQKVAQTVDVALEIDDARYRASMPAQAFHARTASATSMLVMAKRRLADPVDVIDWNLRCSLNEEHTIDAPSVVDVMSRAAFAPLYPSSQRTYRLKTRYSFTVKMEEPGVVSGQAGGAPKKTAAARSDEKKKQETTRQQDKVKEKEKEKEKEKKVKTDADPSKAPPASPAPARALVVDLTVVRTMKVSPTESVRLDELSTHPETYEAEMEFHGIRDTAEDLLAMLKQWTVALKVVYDVDVLLPVSEHRQLVREYASLTSQGEDPSRYKLFGPKLVTLELLHLRAATAGDVSSPTVMNGDYAVTEKADGEHRLLFVAESGLAYTVDDRLNVRSAGCAYPSYKSSLFEGEYLLASASGDRAARMLLFDAFFINGKAIYSQPFAAPEEVGASSAAPAAKQRQGAATRLGIVRKFVEDQRQQSPASCLAVAAKEFVGFGTRQELASVVKRMLARRDAGSYAYGVDGLIFTPASYPLGADGPQGKAAPTGTWMRAFKWKPPAFNTIDFLVRFQTAEREVRDGEVYRVAHLFVAYNLPYLKPITSEMFLSHDIPWNTRRRFVPAPFQPPDRQDAHVVHLGTVQTADGGVMVKCEDGDELLDGTIAEFRWAAEADSGGGGWVPIRVRHDKTEKYYKTKEIAGTANKHETALSVWSSIINPVTEEVLCRGSDGIASVDGADPAVYYTQSLTRSASKTAGLRAFHNRWVKGHHLLHRFKGKASTLADFGCGRAGDLPKWQHMGLARVLGLDLYADNIRNPKDGAHERALGHLRGKAASRGQPMMAFLPMDMSMPVSPESLLAMSDVDGSGDKSVAQVLWGLVPSPAIKNVNLRAYHGFARSGFDVVSCQFAVHYFFKSAESLDAFAANVANFLKPGGHFVGTCLDAAKVDEALRDVAVGGSIDGRSDGVVVWQILRLYDRLSEDAPGDNIGLKIKVFMESIGQALIEYLVDFRLLVQVLARHGIHPLTPTECAALLGKKGGDATSRHMCMSTGTFDELFQDMRDAREHGGVVDVDAKSLGLASDMSDAEKQYSFLNRWFVFRKAH